MCEGAFAYVFVYRNQTGTAAGRGAGPVRCLPVRHRGRGGALYGRRGQAQASEILSQTRELFAGGSLSEEDQKAFAIEMQRIFMDSKKVAREKFTPKKYRKNNEGNGT